MGLGKMLEVSCTGETNQQPLESVSCAGAGEDLVYVIKLSFNQQMLSALSVTMLDTENTQHPHTGHNRYLHGHRSCSHAV